VFNHTQRTATRLSKKCYIFTTNLKTLQTPIQCFDMVYS